MHWPSYCVAMACVVLSVSLTYMDQHTASAIYAAIAVAILINNDWMNKR